MKQVGRWAALLLLGLWSAVAQGEDSGTLLERSRAVETGSAALLLEHYRFEESLLSPDNDRLTVFVTMPHGARVLLADATLTLNGKQVLRHYYSVDELQLLRDRNAQLLFVTRLPPGEHSIKFDVRAMQGRIVPMKPYTFVKGKNAKFVEFQIAGYEVREVFAVDW